MANFFISRTGKKSTFSEDANGNLNIETISADSEFYEYEKSLKVVVLDSDDKLRVTKLKGSTIQSHDSDTEYLPGDIVEYDNSLWKATKTVTKGYPRGNENLDSEWVQIAGSGGGIELYDSDKSWSKDDLVVYNDSIYAANTDKVGNGAPFAVESSGDNTWRPVSTGLTLPVWSVGGFSAWTSGINTMTVTDSSKGFNNIVSGSVEIPSSGLYKLRAQSSHPGNQHTFQWRNITTGTLLGKKGKVTADFTSNHVFTDAHAIVELSAGDFVGVNTDVVSGLDNSNTEFGSWSIEKIGGYTPILGHEAQNLHLRHDSDTDAPATFNNIILNTPVVQSGIVYESSTGRITLSRDVTYEVEAVLAQNDSAQGSMSYRWYNVATGTPIGVAGYAESLNANVNTSNQSSAYLMITPSENMVIELRMTANNNGKLRANHCYIKAAAISKQLPLADTALRQWEAGKSYDTDDVVIYQDAIYTANGPTTSSTFTVATSGANTWRAVGQTALVAEYGEEVLSAGFEPSTTGEKDVLTFDIPSAGVWEIDYVVRGGNTYTSDVSAYIKRADGTEVAESRVMIGATGSAGEQGTGTGTTRVTTQGAETLSLKANFAGVGGNIYSDDNGKTKVTWKKISGYVPVKGFATEEGYYSVAGGTNPGVGNYFNLTSRGGNLPVQNSNEVELQAGVTYELVAGLDFRANWATFTWFDRTNSANLGNEGSAFSANGNDSGSAAHAYAIVTPSTNVRVSLKLSGTDSYTDVKSDVGQISIKAISKQLPVTEKVDSVFASYTASAHPTSNGDFYTLSALNETGGIELRDSNQTIYLPAAGTYKLHAAMAHRSTYVNYEWVNKSDTDNKLPGTNTGNGSSANSSDPGVASPAAGYYTTTEATEIKLKVVGADTLLDNFQSFSSVMVQKVAGIDYSVKTLNSITDVNVSGVSTGDYLRFDGSEWKKTTPTSTTIQEIKRTFVSGVTYETSSDGTNWSGSSFGTGANAVRIKYTLTPGSQSLSTVWTNKITFNVNLIRGGSNDDKHILRIYANGSVVFETSTDQLYDRDTLGLSNTIMDFIPTTGTKEYIWELVRTNGDDAIRIDTSGTGMIFEEVWNKTIKTFPS